MQYVGLNFLASDRTWAPALGAKSLSHWTTREVPKIFLSKQELCLSCQLWPCNWGSIEVFFIFVLNVFQFFSIKIFYLFFLAMSLGMRILVPQPGIESSPSDLEAQSLNHWTTREVLNLAILGSHVSGSSSICPSVSSLLHSVLTSSGLPWWLR